MDRQNTDAQAQRTTLTPAQQRVLDLLTERGSAWLNTQTNPAMGTVHSGAARALQDKGLIRIWQRSYGFEAVLPDSKRDNDVDGIGR
jgi:hypothetical protein